MGSCLLNTRYCNSFFVLEIFRRVYDSTAAAAASATSATSGVSSR